MVGVLTLEQQNRSRQITKLEGGFGALNLRPGGGGGSFWPPPLWFFEDNSKTKRSSITKLGIPFH